jgi:hypothetical protein
MKKSKLLTKVAYPAAPQYADGFVPPAGYDHKIIVNLQNVDIKVYGFDGTQWEMIHNADGVVDNFIGNVLHQKYYFESKTGVEQIVRASFLSSEEKAPLELDFGATHETRKFHHIEEVPAYYGSDEGKMLTIMSDGSLRWLGVNESYVVEVIGGGEDGVSDSPEPLLWEDKFTLGGDASLYDDGDAGNVMRTNTTGFAWSFYDQFLTSEDPDQMIVSFWFKCNDEPMNTLRRDLFGSRSGAWGVMAKLIGNGSEIQLKSTYSSGAYVSPPPSKFYTIDLQRNVWYNVVITLDKVAGFARTYVNGVMVSEQSVTSTAQWSLGTNSKFGFGSTKSGSDNSATSEIFDFDSFQMKEGFALTDEQIASIYNDGSNREVVVASDM